MIAMALACRPALLIADVKVASDADGPEVDPDTVERLPDAQREHDARAYAAHRFPGLAGAPVVGSRVCQYDVTDRHALRRRPASRTRDLVARRRRLRPRLQARPGARRVCRRLPRGAARARAVPRARRAHRRRRPAHPRPHLVARSRLRPVASLSSNASISLRSRSFSCRCSGFVSAEAKNASRRPWTPAAVSHAVRPGRGHLDHDRRAGRRCRPAAGSARGLEAVEPARHRAARDLQVGRQHAR